jgi:hypothetical protein
MSRVLVTAILACAVCTIAATAVHAQRPAPPQNWAGAYFQMFTDMGSFDDPDSDSRWIFGDNAMGLGAVLQRQLGASLRAGIDLGYARPSYERRDAATQTLIFRGDASVLTALASGRIAYGGGADLGFYLTGGAGAIVYDLEDVDGSNADMALRAGTGLEYRFNPTKLLFLEWGRLWGYHEKEGVSGGKATHSLLRIGAQLGF